MSRKNLGKHLYEDSYLLGSFYARKFCHTSFSMSSYTFASSVIVCYIHKDWISGSSGGFKYCWFSYI